MRYTSSIVIQKPIDQTVKDFRNYKNMKHWQKDLVRIKHLNSDNEENGTISELIYNIDNREISLIETIIFEDFPEIINITYDSERFYNIQENTFEALSKDCTKWTSKNEFKLSGFIKIIGIIKFFSVRNRFNRYMQSFKAFTEEGKSILDPISKQL